MVVEFFCPTVSDKEDGMDPKMTALLAPELADGTLGDLTKLAEGRNSSKTHCSQISAVLG